MASRVRTSRRCTGQVASGDSRSSRPSIGAVSGQRRADVVAKVRALEGKRDAGTGGTAGRGPTVAAWLDHWLANIAAPKARPSTLQRYRQLETHQLSPKVGHHRLDRLQPEHVERMYAELLASGLSPASVLQAHRVLSRALKVAMQRSGRPQRVCPGRRAERRACRGRAADLRRREACLAGSGGHAQRRTVVGGHSPWPAPGRGARAALGRRRPRRRDAAGAARRCSGSAVSA